MVAEPTLAELDLFRDEEHEPFLWPAERPAALFVHGFPGTPAEMRPLAQAFQQTGWTTQGLLLPGFGQQIGTLYQYRPDDWVTHTREALSKLQAEHEPVLLVGYSMGAAVCLQVAAEAGLGERPDGLLLLAPFWRLGTRLQALVWRLVSTVFRSFKPLRAVSFDDPRVREAIGGFLPDLDLDSSQVRQSLRNLKVPTAFINSVLDLGRASGTAAARVTVPTLIVQGVDDEVMRARTTRRLLSHFPGPVRYAELAADHELLSLSGPRWQELVELARRFGDSLESK